MCEQHLSRCPVNALEEALIREQNLLREKDALLAEQELLRSESDHRLLNGLQLVVSLLSLQSRTAVTPEVAAQLSIAANRVATIERVHRRLHYNDGTKTVELKKYLTAFSASSTVAQTATPFPAARPSALITTGAPWVLTYARAGSASSNVTDRAVGTFAASMICLAKTLLPSICAAALDGPNTRKPSALSLSALLALLLLRQEPAAR